MFLADLKRLAHLAKTDDGEGESEEIMNKTCFCDGAAWKSCRSVESNSKN